MISFLRRTIRFSIPLLVLVMTGMACQAGFYRKSLLLEDDRVAIYSLPADSYPSDDDIQAELPPMVQYPELSEEQLVALLGNI